MDLITLLRAAITSGGGTPASFNRIQLLQQLVTTYGGTPTKFTVAGLLKEAIIARGGTPTQQTNVALLRELILTLGATPTTYAEAALTVQLAGLSIGGVVLPPAPAFTTQPSISPSSGTAGVTSFTATNGAASNAASYSRRWLLNGTAVSTAGFYTPNAAGSLVLEVTATGAGGSTIASSPAVTIAAEGSVTPPPVFSVVPTISGTPTEGQTLTATTGTASNSPSYTLQWKRAGVNISGATNTTYVLQAADVGSTITVTSTATNAGGSVSQTSIATAAVASAASGLDPAISAPTLSLVTANTTYPPQFDIGLDDTAVVGDTIRLQWDNNADFGSLTGEATNTIDAGEASANAASFTGLSSLTTGTHRFRARVERGASYGAWSNVVTQGPDDVAPALSALSSIFLTSTTGKALFTTNEANGTARAVVTTTNVAPSQGTMDASAFSLAISSTGAKEINFTGLTGSTLYYAWVQHTDATGNKSAITAAGSFTTAAAGSFAAKLTNGTTGSVDRSPSIAVTDNKTITGTTTQGSNCPARIDLSMPDDSKFEVLIGANGANGDQERHVGVSDRSLAYGPTEQYKVPGGAGTPVGITLRFKPGNGTLGVFYNGIDAEYAFFGVAPAIGDTIEVSRSGAAYTFRIKQGATTYSIGPYTLTSPPSDPTGFAGVGFIGDVLTVNAGAQGAFVLTSTKTGW